MVTVIAAGHEQMKKKNEALVVHYSFRFHRRFWLPDFWLILGVLAIGASGVIIQKKKQKMHTPKKRNHPPRGKTARAIRVRWEM